MKEVAIEKQERAERAEREGKDSDGDDVNNESGAKGEHDQVTEVKGAGVLSDEDNSEDDKETDILLETADQKETT